MNAFTTRPDATEYAPGFGMYLALVPKGDLREVLAAQLAESLELLSGIPASAAVAVHPPYTWTLKQVVGHITDADRVMGYRILWMARLGDSPLPGFDENGFMGAADFNRWPLAELVEEFAHVRRANLDLLNHLSEEAWTRGGAVSDHPATVRAIACVMAGHAAHHLEILRSRLNLH
ncbi:MAG TPA: DinB family protein [Lacipirellula sp.]